MEYILMSALTAIADSTQRQILALLREGELPVGALVEMLKLSQPNVSKHLSALREAGLVPIYRKRVFSATVIRTALEVGQMETFRPSLCAVTFDISLGLKAVESSGRRGSRVDSSSESWLCRNSGRLGTERSMNA
jgi:DNA-binding transcriptional ArsR family regulator